ncbi:MAG: hypothetical protein WBX25_19505 [Rhodomicrobium sp.]
MSEDNEWRQLGSIVNAVLLEAKTKATERGSFSGTKPYTVSSGRPETTVFSQRAAERAFLNNKIPGTQLELPFGIASAPIVVRQRPGTPRAVRLM